MEKKERNNFEKYQNIHLLFFVVVEVVNQKMWQPWTLFVFRVFPVRIFFFFFFATGTGYIIKLFLGIYRNLNSFFFGGIMATVLESDYISYRENNANNIEVFQIGWHKIYILRIVEHLNSFFSRNKDLELDLKNFILVKV